MNELALTYPSLLEKSMDFCDDKIKEIKKTIEHYKRLNMPQVLINKAKNGAVSVLLSSMGMQMIKAEPDEYKDYLIFKVDELGNDDKERMSWDIPNGKDSNVFWWKLSMLKNYTDPVPLEFLERLPDTASEKAWVFHPMKRSALDPILVYPLMYKNKNLSIKTVKTLPTRGLARLISPIYTKTVKVVTPEPGPYFAGIFKW